MPQESADAWLESLVAQYQGPLISYARRLLGDESSARDVVQETFLRLLRQDNARALESPAAWLYAVCRRAALDVKRKDRRMTTLTDDASAILKASARGADDPASLVESADSARQAMDMLERLPENQREVLVLKFGHGLTYRQIAQVTGHTAANVGFLIHMGMKALRRQAGAAC